MNTELSLTVETKEELMARLKNPVQAVHHLEEAYHNLSVKGILMAVHDIMEAQKGEVH